VLIGGFAGVNEVIGVNEVKTILPLIALLSYDYKQQKGCLNSIHSFTSFTPTEVYLLILQPHIIKDETIDIGLFL